MAALLVATAVRPDAQIFAEPPADTTSAGSDLPTDDDEYVVEFDGILPAVCQGGLVQLQSDACASAMEEFAPDPIVVSDEIIEIVDCSDENVFVDDSGILSGLAPKHFSSQAIDSSSNVQAFIKKCCETGTRKVCKTKYKWMCVKVPGKPVPVCGFMPVTVCEEREV